MQRDRSRVGRREVRQSPVEGACRLDGRVIVQRPQTCDDVSETHEAERRSQIEYLVGVPSAVLGCRAGGQVAPPRV